jgi:DNA-binding transcriptional regulator YdaS (Cro superfamily)
MNAIDKAIKYFGSQKKMGESLGITQQSVSDYRKFGVPAKRALEIERKTKGHVTRHELRPDLYI